MPTLGMIGGLGPESTIDYYRRILEAWEQVEPGTAPSIVIDSLDVRRALRLVESDRPALTDYLLASLRRLAGAGVDFAVMTANTPHIVFDDLVARSPVPLLSIVEVCAQEARERGLGRLALLGTRFTMEGPFYPEVCARYGIAVVTPGDADRAWTGRGAGSRSCSHSSSVNRLDGRGAGKVPARRGWDQSAYGRRQRYSSRR